MFTDVDRMSTSSNSSEDVILSMNSLMEKGKYIISLIIWFVLKEFY